VIVKAGKSMEFTRYWAGRIGRFDPGQFVVVARKPLAEIAIYSVAMPVTVGLCLWVLLGPLRIDRYLGIPIPGLTKADSAAPTAAPVPGDKTVPMPGDKAVSLPGDKAVPAPDDKSVPVPGDKEDSATATVILFPGDDGRLLTQLQGALVRKGYSVGPAGADANDNALTALEAFQDDHALPVQPKCDQHCRTALGLPDPQ
jgi:hypothetical protein